MSQVAESKEILCYMSGSNSGILERPTSQSLLDTFGTSDFEEIVKFMLDNGSFHEYGRYKDVHSM